MMRRFISTCLFVSLLSFAHANGKPPILKADIEVVLRRSLIHGISEDSYSLRIFMIGDRLFAVLSQEMVDDPFKPHVDWSSTVGPKHIELSDEDVSELNEYFATMVALEKEDPTVVGWPIIEHTVTLTTFRGEQSRRTQFTPNLYYQHVDPDGVTPDVLRQRIVESGKSGGVSAILAERR
ncbi:MAG: hypothetical protein ACQKBV_02995 [Puniceicoccales bacterium]